MNVFNRIRRQRWARNARNNGFSIIASNCWGTTVYQDLALPYQTPFVGLFLFPDCYLKLVSNLSTLDAPLRFTESSRYEPDTRYPIGILDDDIELHFVHEQSSAQANEKWSRRLARLNPDRLFFAFTDRDGATQSHLRRFDELPHARKVCFTARDYPDLQSTISVPAYASEPCVGDLFADRRAVDPCFDVLAWLNDQPAKRNPATP